MSGSEKNVISNSNLRLCKEIPEDARPIPGWPEYMACTNGEIISLRSLKGKTPVYKTQSIGIKGYYKVVSLQKDGRQFVRTVHKLLLETFVGPAPEGHVCRHIDGDSHNNSLTNLTWGTQAENCQDTVSHGMSTFGERSGRSKLRENDVRHIISELESGRTATSLANEMGLSTSHVCKIAKGKTWGHLDCVKRYSGMI